MSTPALDPSKIWERLDCSKRRRRELVVELESLDSPDPATAEPSEFEASRKRARLLNLELTDVEESIAQDSSLLEALKGSNSTAASKEPEKPAKSVKTLSAEERLKQKRPSLNELPRSVQAPQGGWFDQQGRLHIINSTRAELYQNLLNLLWEMEGSLPVEPPILPTPDPEDETPCSAIPISAISLVRDNIHSLIWRVSELSIELRLRHSHGNAAGNFFLSQPDAPPEGEDLRKRFEAAIKASKSNSSATPRRSFPRPNTSQQLPSKPSRGGKHLNPPRKADPSPPLCFSCHNPGHFAKDCPWSDKQNRAATNPKPAQEI